MAVAVSARVRSVPLGDILLDDRGWKVCIQNALAGHFLLLSKNKSVFGVDAQRWQANEEATDTREVAAHAKLLARII